MAAEIVHMRCDQGRVEGVRGPTLKILKFRSSEDAPIILVSIMTFTRNVIH